MVPLGGIQKQNINPGYKKQKYVQEFGFSLKRFLLRRINFYCDLKNVENSQPSKASASTFKSFPQSLEHFFLTAGQNNFGNKIPFLLDILQEGQMY